MIKVFVLYHKLMPIFKSEVFEPLQTGCEGGSPIPGFLHDNEGANISVRNGHYAELTGNYWVWKSYLPKHPEVDYVGFCHYRRNWDFSKQGKENDVGFVQTMTYGAFRHLFNRQSSQTAVGKVLDGYDLLVSEKQSVASYGMTNYDAYVAIHPREALTRLQSVIAAKFPDYVEDMEAFWTASSGYFCLNYIMRRNLFEDFMGWMFAWLTELDKVVDWSLGKDYMSQKAPAYLAERMFNVWLMHLQRTRSIRLRECRGLVLREPSWGGFKKELVAKAVRFYHHNFRKRILA